MSASLSLILNNSNVDETGMENLSGSIPASSIGTLNHLRTFGLLTVTAKNKVWTILPERRQLLRASQHLYGVDLSGSGTNESCMTTCGRRCPGQICNDMKPGPSFRCQSRIEIARTRALFGRLHSTMYHPVCKMLHNPVA